MPHSAHHRATAEPSEDVALLVLTPEPEPELGPKIELGPGREQEPGSTSTKSSGAHSLRPGSLRAPISSLSVACKRVTRRAATPRLGVPMVVGHPRAGYAIATAAVVLLLGEAMQTAARRARPRAASTSPPLLGCDASSSLDEHLSELPMLGMHVLRARDGAGCDGSGAEDAALLDVYVDGLQKDLFVREDYSRAAPSLELACPGGPQSSVAVSARAWLLRPLQKIVGRHRPRLVDRLVQKKRLTQQAARELLNSTAAFDSDAALRRWRVFTPHGDGVTLVRKAIVQALAECDTLYVFEGGRFAWPGVSVGFKRTITLRADDATDAVATTFSLMPLVLSVEGLLTNAECDQIIAEAEPHMVASPVSKHAGERPGNDPGNATEDSWQELSLVRTSTQTRVPPGADQTCLTLDRRAHRVLRVPDSHGEPLQVLRYHEAEFYDGKNELLPFL